MLERLGGVRMAAVRIGGVKKAQPAVVGVEQQIGQPLHAERGLMRVMPRADGSRAHGKAAGLDAGAAERDRVRSRELRRKRLRGNRVKDGFGREPRGSYAGSRASEEFAAMHKSSYVGGA